MTVLLNSMSGQDNSVGIVGMSRHQGWWNHSPNMRYEVNPDRGLITWTEQNLGIGSSRLSRSPLLEQFTGHTAVISRVGGQVQLARGLVPNVTGYPWAFFGEGGGGHWQDDIAMLSDPTCISFEIPVTAEDAENFPQWFDVASSQINVYALRSGDGFNSFNCVLASLTILINYLLDSTNDYSSYVSQLTKVEDSLQGHLMQNMMDGFQ
ncbi:MULTISPECIES: hypothetical protein [unclassified Xanthomonas]|uniref:hypothetical protein n=1 Tax=unclassified Xanthomonas TaxID=2643310 RepID=UPI002B22550A|nr:MULTISPECIES: hypothetical protein [unclassified Xanthomonas]MEA9564525.1 hypothetical protein [Xanthomonas sp. WHRI 8932A]MEA9635943.1 hypothetical protein [Xanthomonas sp. WHRI 8812E]